MDLVWGTVKDLESKPRLDHPGRDRVFGYDDPNLLQSQQGPQDGDFNLGSCLLEYKGT